MLNVPGFQINEVQQCQGALEKTIVCFTDKNQIYIILAML